MTNRIAISVVAATAVAAIGFLFSASHNPASAWLCTYKTEVTSGINRICIYECPTGDATITVSVASICPISINQ